VLAIASTVPRNRTGRPRFVPELPRTAPGVPPAPPPGNPVVTHPVQGGKRIEIVSLEGIDMTGHERALPGGHRLGLIGDFDLAGGQNRARPLERAVDRRSTRCRPGPRHSSSSAVGDKIRSFRRGVDRTRGGGSPPRCVRSQQPGDSRVPFPERTNGQGTHIRNLCQVECPRPSRRHHPRLRRWNRRTSLVAERMTQAAKL